MRETSVIKVDNLMTNICVVKLICYYYSQDKPGQDSSLASSSF